MRKISILLYLAAAMFAAACSAYDDSDINARIDRTDRRLAELEQLAQQVNAGISTASTIVDALQKGDLITSCEVLPGGDGYVISFAESPSVTVYHGQDGTPGTDGEDAADGQDAPDGVSPVIGIAKDEDGQWCWTLGGEFLEGPDGSRIYISISATQGRDGVVPTLRVKDGMWQVSYDSGRNWSDLTAVSPDKQESPYIFTKVEEGDELVTFTLAGGDSFSIFKLGVPNLTLSGWEDALVVPNRSVEVVYSISGATSRTSVRALGNNGYTASVNAASVSSGSITVAVPASSSEGDVLVIADNGYGSLSIRKMHFNAAGITVSDLEEIGDFVDFEW